MSALNLCPLWQSPLHSLSLIISAIWDCSSTGWFHSCHMFIQSGSWMVTACSKGKHSTTIQLLFGWSGAGCWMACLMLGVWTLKQNVLLLWSVLLPWAPHWMPIFCHSSLVWALGPWKWKARQLTNVYIICLFTSPVFTSDILKVWLQ